MCLLESNKASMPASIKNKILAKRNFIALDRLEDKVNLLITTINNYRNNITNLTDSTGRNLPKPLGLNAIKYSYTLEKEAEEIASNCQYHNENGFNSFLPPDFSWIPKRAVDFWIEKLKFYNYETNQCDHDSDLLHTSYDRCRTARQIVDDSVSFIGCGWSLCESNDGENYDAELFICKFDSVKSSNQRPYRQHVLLHDEIFDKVAGVDKDFKNLNYVSTSTKEFDTKRKAAKMLKKSSLIAVPTLILLLLVLFFASWEKCVDKNKDSDTNLDTSHLDIDIANENKVFIKKRYN